MRNIFSKKLNHTASKLLIIVTVTTLVIITLSLFLKIAWPIYLLTIIIGLFLLPLPKALTAITSILLLLFSLMALIQLEALIFFVIDTTANTFTYAFINLALTLAIIVTFYSRNQYKPRNIQFTTVDILILTPAIVITGLFWGRVILHPKDDTASVIQSISYGMDDASHAGIFSDLLRSNGNLPIRADDRIKMTKSVHASYPMGWHISTAVLTESIVDVDNQPIIHTVWAYFYVKLGTLLVTILTLSAFLYTIFSNLKISFKKILDKIIFFITSIGIAVLLIIPLFFEGFFSFLPIISYTLLFAILLIKKDDKNETSTDIIQILLIVASALTWMLTVPILLVAFLHKKYAIYGRIRSMPKYIFAGIALALATSASQAYILLQENSAVYAGIANPGGITNPSDLLLALCLLIAVIIFISKNTYYKALHNLAYIIFPAIFILATVMIYIGLKSPELTYYYYKLQTVLLLLLLPLVCAYLIKSLSLQLGDNSYISKKSFTIMITIYLMSIPSVIGFNYFSNILNRAQDYVITDSIATSLKNQVLNSQFKINNPRTFYYYPESSAYSILASSIARLPYSSRYCDNSIFQGIYINDLATLNKSLGKCIGELPPITIITDQAGRDSLIKNISRSTLSQDITIKIVEPL